MDKNKKEYNRIKWSCVTKDGRRFDEDTQNEITDEINHLFSLLQYKYNIKNIYITAYVGSENS